MLGAVATLGAQVGYEPARSPYRDLELTHELSLLTGLYRAHHDPARVAPQSGPLLGIRYQWLVGGPANLTTEIARVGSERRVLDPELPGTCTGTAPADCKLIAVYRWPLYLADVGLALNLTGARSFHGLVPELRAGLGMVTDFHTRADVGDFAFGTRFAFSWGAGVRWLPHRSEFSRWLLGPVHQLRLDLGNRAYSVKYPESYFTAAPDGSTIRPVFRKKASWTNNAALTVGLSYLFGR